jgi:hypothetical protein
MMASLASNLSANNRNEAHVSTAALMHDRNISDERIPLSQPERYYRVIAVMEHTIQLHLVGEHHNDRLGEVQINFPQSDWRGGIKPANVYCHVYNADPINAVALAEMLEIASWAATFANGDFEEQRQAAERARQEREAQREKERAEWQERQRLERERREAELKVRYARTDELIEELKWQLGEEIRLQRENMRSTVFGTIDAVYPGDHDRYHKRRHMDITTERGKHMDIDLTTVTWLEMKDPESSGTGRRTKWDRIYPKNNDERE